MKKIIALFFCAGLAALCSFSNAFFNSFTLLAPDAKVAFYCSAPKQTLPLETIYSHETKNGDGFIYTTTAQNAQDVYKTLSGCYGFSATTSETRILPDILSKISVLKTQTTGDITSYFGTTSGLAFFNFLDGQKVNIQIAVTLTHITIGSPIILGDY